MEMNTMPAEKKGKDLGRELFLANYNCAQSTLAGILSEFNRGYKERVKLAGAFGAGIAQQGLMCGAVTGALMAIGVMVPMGSDIGKWNQEVADISKDYIREFEKRFGHLNCSELAGCDMRDASNRKVFHDEGGRDRICTPMVMEGVELASEIIRKRR